jgi:hypothetical protein
MSETSRAPATIVRNKDRRETATVDDEYNVRPPQVYVLADEGAHKEAIQAVARVIAENPNASNGPAVMGRDDGEFGELMFTYRPNELPAVGENGELKGWLAPYRAEEDLRDGLREHLPAGWSFEAERQGRMVLFKE